MRVLKYVFLPAIALVMVLLAMPFAQSALAEEPPPQATPVMDEPNTGSVSSRSIQPHQDEPTVTLTYDTPELVNPQAGDIYTFTVKATFSDTNARGTPTLSVSRIHRNLNLPLNVEQGYGELNVEIVLIPEEIRWCEDSPIAIRIQLNGRVGGVFFNEIDWASIPCSITTTPVYPDTTLITQTALCGANNDEITFEQEGVEFSLDGWDNDENTIRFTAAEGYILPDDAITSHPLRDADTPCIESFSLGIEDGTFLDRRDGVPVNIDVTFTLADTHPYDTIYIFHQQDTTVFGFVSPWFVPVEPGVGGSTTVTIPFQTKWGQGSTPNYCIPWLRSVDIYASISGITDEVRDTSNQLTYGPETFPCSWIYETEPEITITQVEICGPNNDTFEISVEPDIATFTVDEWQDGTTTIDIDWGITEYFAWHYDYLNLEFRDTGDPCLESISLDADDGAFVDVAPIHQVPLNAAVTLHDTHDYEAVHLTLPNTPLGIQHHIFDVEPGDGGPYIVQVEYPGTPFGHEQFVCVDGEIEIEIVARPYSGSENRVIPGEETSTIASFPCSFLIQATPDTDVTQVTVCGPNNDVFEIASQPNGVEYTIHNWEDGSTTIEFYPADGYYFWDVDETEFPFSDSSTPCPTDAPVKPVQTQVCGPDNDQITIPPQPEGVTLENDSGWENGTRNISFNVDPAFITHGESEFIFTDENIACPTPTTDLTVQLIPSDGLSIEGASWQLYAPVAAQNIGTEPYAEGTVGADNSIVVEGLIAGDYRLVVNAEGYERIDTVITVESGKPTFAVQLPIAALQPEPVETPSPSPTTEPTAAPTKEPTAVSTPSATPESAPTEPASESADVTGLPSTGSGPGGGFGILAMAGLLAAMVLGIIGNRRRIQA